LVALEDGMFSSHRCTAKVIMSRSWSFRQGRNQASTMKQESASEPIKNESPSPMTPQPKRERNSAESTTPPRVLIVEDEFAIGIDIQDQLTGLGYVVVGITAFGEEAVKLAETLRPELVLMDINLRGELNGVAAAEQIRSRFSLPVVYVTANMAVARAQTGQPF